MKTLIELLEATKKKELVATMGRLQPPTRGHELAVHKVRELAGQLGADHRVFPSTKHGGDTPKEEQKNPLPFETKVKFLKKFFPKTNIHDEPNVHNPFHMMQHAHDSGYGHVHLVVGGEAGQKGERFDEFHKTFGKYKTEKGTYKIPHEKGGHFEIGVTLHSAGKRDDKSKGVEGVSGTKVRQMILSSDHTNPEHVARVREHLPTGASDKDAASLIKHIKTHTERMAKEREAAKLARKEAKKAAKPAKPMPKKKKPLLNSYDPVLADILNVFLTEKESKETRRKRDRRMYGHGKSPSELTPKQRLNRKKKSKRTVARRKANKEGRTKKGDSSVELDHKNGNALDNGNGNLRVVSRHHNRSRNNNKNH
jgi:hypothetical protein